MARDALARLHDDGVAPHGLEVEPRPERIFAEAELHEGGLEEDLLAFEEGQELAASQGYLAAHPDVAPPPGLIVGESLWGVLNAGLIVGLSNDAPIALVPAEFGLAPWLGVIGFVGAIVLLYGWMLRRSAAVVR